jgi:hypothetical protein
MGLGLSCAVGSCEGVSWEGVSLDMGGDTVGTSSLELVLVEAIGAV